jgi:hypothetical protein
MSEYNAGNRPYLEEQDSHARSVDYPSKAEVAQPFRVTTRTVESWMNKGLIPYIRIERTIRFDMKDVDAALLRMNAKN